MAKRTAMGLQVLTSGAAARSNAMTAAPCLLGGGYQKSGAPNLGNAPVPHAQKKSPLKQFSARQEFSKCGGNHRRVRVSGVFDFRLILLKKSANQQQIKGCKPRHTRLCGAFDFLFEFHRPGEL
ncbi:hypothetical protein [Paraburkholderia adhaesiva]|uniref:hypothetical protein n=1 Tax=Paraburkholderia adhaesiva TaxID=2883244 RepID=UPI001F453699|nr:hypothetical protein [Paraburkholderia adhaesiva]